SAGSQTRYGYAGDGSHRLTLAVPPVGQAGELIEYAPLPQVRSLAGDLGAAQQFLANDRTGSLAAGATDVSPIARRDTEIQAAAGGAVMLGVEVTAAAGSALQAGVPAIPSLTPVVVRPGAGTAFAAFAVDRSGLQTLRVTGASAATAGAYR